MVPGVAFLRSTALDPRTMHDCSAAVRSPQRVPVDDWTTCHANLSITISRARVSRHFLSSTMAAAASSPAGVSLKEAEVYDRQIRLWGVEAQRRMTSSRVLVAGLGGLMCEVCCVWWSIDRSSGVCVCVCVCVDASRCIVVYCVRTALWWAAVQLRCSNTTSSS